MDTVSLEAVSEEDKFKVEGLKPFVGTMLVHQVTWCKEEKKSSIKNYILYEIH